MHNLILFTLSTLALLIHPLSLASQNSFSISLDKKGRDILPAVREPVGGEEREADYYIYRRQMNKNKDVIRQKSNLPINAEM